MSKFLDNISDTICDYFHQVSQGIPVNDVYNVKNILSGYFAWLDYSEEEEGEEDV